MNTQSTRRISPLMLFMLSMNGIIGSGWLFAPFYAAKIAGPGALIAWLIGGVAAILIALTFAELSVMLPVSGSSAHIPQLSHGVFASFMLSWVGWITTLMLTAVEVQAVLQYASLYFPSLIQETNDVPMLTMHGYSAAAMLMFFLSVMNIWSWRGLMRFNFILFLFKISVMLFTIYAISRQQFHLVNFNGWLGSTTTTEGWQAIFTAVATSGIVLAFNGFKSGVDLSGETRNLAVAIPLSTVGSVIGCLLLYIGLQVCFIGALEPAVLQRGWQHLSFVGDMGPFVGLAMALGLFWILKLLYLNSVISPLGAGLIYVTSNARLMYAMSRIGYVPKFLSRLNKQRFPVWAILINFALGMFAFLPLPGWQAMVNFLVSAMLITYAMGPISLICLRYSLPNEERPFRLPCAYLVSLVAFYGCNLFCYWSGWEIISKLGVILALGFILFVMGALRGSIKVETKDWKAACWILPYLSGIIAISWLGSFGGMHFIPFGWDFLIIAIFSLGIFQAAIFTRAPLQDHEVKKFLTAEAMALEGTASPVA